MLIRVRIDTRWNKRRIQKLKSRHPEMNCNKIIFNTQSSVKLLLTFLFCFIMPKLIFDTLNIIRLESVY